MLLRYTCAFVFTFAATWMPAALPTMTLLNALGEFSVGSTMLMARHGLFRKTLSSMYGDELLMNDTTPERNWLSQELPSNQLRVIVGDELFPPTPAPKPPPPELLFMYRLLVTIDPVPMVYVPAPSDDPPVTVKPCRVPNGPIVTVE